MKRKIKNISHRLSWGFGLLLAVIFSTGFKQLQAEATKEIFSEGGLYAPLVGSATHYTNVLSWSFSITTLDGNAVDVTPPEGLKSMKSTVSTRWGGWGVFNVTGPGSTVVVDRNYSDYVNGSLRFFLRSNNPLTVEIEYVRTNGTQWKIPAAIPTTSNNWVEIVIPFSAIMAADPAFNLARIRSPFSISFTGNSAPAKTWYVDHVRWTKPVASLHVFPPLSQVNPGKNRQFTVEGRSASGEQVIVYSSFTTAASVGTVVPAAPIQSQSTILTGASGSGAIVIKSHNQSATANVAVVGTDLNQRFGLFSETIPGVTFPTDSALIVFKKNGLPDPVFVNDFTDYREGTFSLKTTVNQSAADDFTGWSVQWGSTNTTDSTTRDMSNYYDGSLRFWIKAPAALNGKLSVGMRSGNVAPGKEISITSLAPYMTFNNTWQPVVIPLTVFAKSRPWADLARMKNLVTFSVVGPTGGAQSFSVDNIRWDTQVPGPLTGITVSPNTALIPLNGSRQFVAEGQSATGTVDIVPTWSFGGPSLGTILSPTSDRTVLKAGNTAVSGTIRATVGGISGSASVTVGPIAYTQSYNIYSDIGSGGMVGVATGTAPSGTTMTLQEVPGIAGNPAPEGTSYRRATFTLDNLTTAPDSYALWFTEDFLANRYMRFYQNGYLRFWVRTTHDLQISIRSASITAGTELSKIRLSEIGIPLDGNWQEVVISLADFKLREPRLNFDEMKTFFAITALSQLSGEVSNKTFDVDDVKWLTADAATPDEDKIFQGLKNAQNPTTGLVRSYHSRPSAFTYDQALAAMNFTYRKHVISAARIFNFYKAKYDADRRALFADEYDVATEVIRDANRTTGPTAWLLLSMLHYRNVTGDSTYNPMMMAMANALKDYQDNREGGVTMGQRVNPAENSVYSTEHNFDAYAAFLAYTKAGLSNSHLFQSRTNNVRNWLNREMWNNSQKRFYVGTKSDGETPNTDKALDVYSWAVLAMSSYTSVAALAEVEFGTTSVSGTTGALIQGFDFSGCFNNPVDKDAVWMEGTAQMALAFLNAGNESKYEFYMDQLRRGVFVIDASGAQGIAYATRAGTAYANCNPSNAMDAINASVAASSWYLFAARKFNPFKVFPTHTADLRDRTSHYVSTTIGWTGSAPGVDWLIADQYIRLDAQPISIDSWGIQIYTNNTSTSATIRYVDPSPLQPNNLDSNPAGLVLNSTTTRATLPLGWSIKDSTVAVGIDLIAADPNTGPETGVGNRYQWFYMKDRATPAIDQNGDGLLTGFPLDGDPFVNAEDYVVIKTGAGIHSAQGAVAPGGYFPSLITDYIYLQADFKTAAASANYAAKIYIEFFNE